MHIHQPSAGFKLPSGCSPQDLCTSNSLYLEQLTLRFPLGWIILAFQLSSSCVTALHFFFFIHHLSLSEMTSLTYMFSSIWLSPTPKGEPTSAGALSYSPLFLWPRTETWNLFGVQEIVGECVSSCGMQFPRSGSVFFFMAFLGWYLRVWFLSLFFLKHLEHVSQKRWRAICCCPVQSLSHVWLCNPIDWSTPGFPVLHYLLEFGQVHVH